MSLSVRKKSKFKEEAIRIGFFLNAFLVVLILAGIFVLLVVNSIPALKEIPIVGFLFNSDWNPTSYVKASYGIGSMLVSTIMVSVGAMLFAIPLSIGTAAYLSDIAGHKTREIAKPVIEILAGIPSVVIGFLGITVVGPFIAKIFNLPDGLNAINGSILLGVMAMPTIISLAEDALKAVPKTYEEASLALGATKWQTIVKVKIPAAFSGIMAAVLLGFGRAIGETMTVLMATGCASAMPHNFTDSVRTLTSTIAIELGEVAYNTTHYYALFATGLILFVITFVVNLIADIVIHKRQK